MYSVYVLFISIRHGGRADIVLFCENKWEWDMRFFFSVPVWCFQNPIDWRQHNVGLKTPGSDKLFSYFDSVQHIPKEKKKSEISNSRIRPALIFGIIEYLLRTDEKSKESRSEWADHPRRVIEHRCSIDHWHLMGTKSCRLPVMTVRDKTDRRLWKGQSD
jgi:hypothetical protein